MIGNDIVDLRFAKKESNWQRPRFLQKIFTEEEQHFIHTAADKDVAVWLLWSGKESAYKIISRLEKRRFFAPKKIVHTLFCADDFSRRSGRDLAAKVVSTRYTFSTKSIITDTHIHTIAHLDDNKKSLTSDCFYISKNNYQSQHQSTRQHLLANYSAMTQRPKNALSIQKDEYQIPYIYYKNKKQSVIISMSHHGNYGGYAMMMNDEFV